jgi:epoxyqueuosine reductase
MEYLAAHDGKRAHPDQLIPGTVRVVSLRMDYLPGDTQMAQRLAQAEKAYVSRYALGRDYHKLVRKRVQHLADRIQEDIGPFGYRAFVDSAPVLEKAIAEQAGLGWIGKNTLLLNRKAGACQRALRTLPGVPGHLPDQGLCRALCAGCQALHFLPDHRVEGRHPRGIALDDGQSGVRLR